MIPESWRGVFHPRDPLTEPRPRATLPETPPNIDLPFQEAAERGERDRNALQDALARLDSSRTRWER